MEYIAQWTLPWMRNTLCIWPQSGAIIVRTLSSSCRCYHHKVHVLGEPVSQVGVASNRSNTSGRTFSLAAHADDQCHRSTRLLASAADSEITFSVFNLKLRHSITYIPNFQPSILGSSRHGKWSAVDEIRKIGVYVRGDRRTIIQFCGPDRKIRLGRA